MSIELLNTALVETIRKQKGVSKKWIWQSLLELNRTDGYLLLRRGLLPEDPVCKKSVLQKLAKFTGKKAADLIVCLIEQDRASA